MAGLWYRAGTVAVTNGSKKVVGTGTTWKSGVSKPDKGHLVWGPDGKPYELDYVESDTVLYLVTAYSGVTASGMTYSIDISRSGSNSAFSRDLSAFVAYHQLQMDGWQQLLTGTGDVTLTAPDGTKLTVPSWEKTMNAVFGHANTVGLHLPPISPANNGMVLKAGSASGSASWGTLTAAAVGATSLDSGFGGSTFGAAFGDSVPIKDRRGFSNVTRCYRAPDAPINNVYLNVMTLPETNGGTSSFLAAGINANGLWVGNGGTNINWQRVYTTSYKPTAADVGAVPVSDVVGSVSSGAIIERGSNANGEYVKWADGTMICTVPAKIFSSIGGGTPVAGYSTTEIIAYAAAFISAPSVTASVIVRSSNDLYETKQFGANTQGFSLWIKLLSSIAAPLFSVTAVGRWK